MNRNNWLLVILVLVLLAACGPRENCMAGHDPLSTHQMRICADKEKYDFGAPIHVTFTVTNISDQPLVLDGGDEAAIDINVKGEHWSSERELTPDLTRVTLDPGESRTLEWVWPTPQTDLEALRVSFGEPGVLSIPVGGLVIPRPGASPGGVWVSAYYRRP